MSCCRNFLVTPANQDHEALTVLAKVNAVAGSKLNLVFKNANTDTLELREIALLHAGQRNGDLRRSARLESVQPIGEGLLLPSSI